MLTLQLKKCKLLHDIVDYYEERYAYLANGNVRNFLDVQERRSVSTFIAWTALPFLHIKVFSRPPLEEVAYSTTLLLC